MNAIIKTKIILKKIMQWGKNVLIAIGRLVNALCAGSPNETITQRLLNRLSQ